MLVTCFVAGSLTIGAFAPFALPGECGRLLRLSLYRKFSPNMAVVPPHADHAVVDYIQTDVEENIDNLVEVIQVDKDNKVKLARVARHNHHKAAKTVVAMVRERMPFSLTVDTAENRLAVNSLAVRSLKDLHVRAGDVSRIAAMVTAFYFVPTRFDQEMLDLENAASAYRAVEEYSARRVSSLCWRFFPRWLVPAERGRVLHRH